MARVLFALQLPLLISIVVQILMFVFYWVTYQAVLAVNKVKLTKGNEFGKMLLFLIVLYSVTLLPFTNTLDFKEWIGFLVVVGEAVLSYIVLRTTSIVVLATYPEIPSHDSVKRSVNAGITICFVVIVLLKLTFLVLNYYYDIYWNFLYDMGLDVLGIKAYKAEIEFILEFLGSPYVQ